MPSIKKNKLSFRSFLIYFCCISIPLIFITLNNTMVRIYQRRDDFDASKQVSASHLNQMILSQFDLMEQTANRIYLSSWYKKYISQAAVYKDEFNIVRQLEISGDLMYNVALLPIADDTLILNTRDNSVICKYGWFRSIQKYSDVYCKLDLSNLPEQLKDISLLTPIRSLNDNFWVLSYPDSNRSSPCRISILIRLSSFQNYLREIHYSDDFAAISVYIEDRLLIQQQSSEPEHNKTEIISMELVRPAIRVVFEYPTYFSLYQVEVITQVIMNTILTVAASFLLAGLFTYFFTLPLEKLLRSIPSVQTTSHREAFDNLSEHINTITSHNKQLMQEIELFTSEMRGQILLHLLIREDSYPSEQRTTDRLFPWLTAKQPYFLVVAQSWEENNPYLFPILANPEEPAGGVIKLDMPLGYTGYMCIRASLASALSAEQKLAVHLRQQPYTQPHFACSPIHTGYEELRVCYHEAVTQMVGRKDELSLADTLSLLNFLNLGEYTKCQQVLSSYHTAGDMVVMRHVLSLLRRWMYENNLSQTVAWTAKDGDQLSWAYIGALLQNLCEQISNTGQAHSSAVITAVNAFMNEYYALPNISLKYLSEQFNVSIGSLSRMYKQETGRNFSTALFEIRMKKAKEMLTQTSQSIASISLACGYENYLSFKRAFIRIEGISPREYRESHLPTDI